MNNLAEFLLARYAEAPDCADIEAKRAIVALYVNSVQALDATLGYVATLQAYFNGLRRVLECLVQQYADHPDFKQEWRIPL